MLGLYAFTAPSLIPLIHNMKTNIGNKCVIYLTLLTYYKVIWLRYIQLQSHYMTSLLTISLGIICIITILHTHHIIRIRDIAHKKHRHTYITFYMITGSKFEPCEYLKHPHPPLISQEDSQVPSSMTDSIPFHSHPCVWLSAFESWTENKCQQELHSMKLDHNNSKLFL